MLLNYNKNKNRSNIKAKSTSSDIIEVEMLPEKEKGDKEEGKAEDKERELNNIRELLAKKNKVLFKRINKMKVVKSGDTFKYEEIIEGGSIMDKENKEINGKEDHRFKSSHSGDITVEVNVINKFKSKNRTCNTTKIAFRINRAGIRVERIKNIGFNRSEIKLYNIKDANKLLDLGQLERIRLR